MKDKFKKIVKGSFGWFTGFFGGTFTELGRSVTHIKKAPLPNSVSLAIMISRVAAMVMFAFSFVIFVLDGGYGDQISIIGQGLVQWSQAFTFGTLANYFGGFALIAWTIVLGLSFFAIHIVCIIKEEGAKRVLMVFLMLLILAALVLYLLFVWGVIYEVSAPIVSFDSLRDNITNNGLQGFAIPIYLGVVVLTLFAASILAMKSALRRQMRQWLSSVTSVYVGLPLLLWFTQNLLALAAMVIFLLLLGGILYLIFKLLVSRLGESDEAGGEGQEQGEGRRVHREHPHAQRLEVEAGARLWKIKSATGDYIQSETAAGATVEVCPAADFDKGKVVIMQGGEQVSFVPWKPKK